ncbi:radical SAM family RiPP maturation amino acid epimerase [Brevundimonas sp.]|uniref:radical SAM family RiPP maturation amino acid epimerase n=1 Tax=Brevundimonas sp. TaxID=1871086 RepID=UPI00391C59D1
MLNLPVSQPTRMYREIWRRRSPEQIRELAHIKRFLECVMGDTDFRSRAIPNRDALIALAQTRGCDIDPYDLLPLWHRDFIDEQAAMTSDRWGASFRWRTYLGEIVATRDAMLVAGDPGQKHRPFSDWRARQIARTRSELGKNAVGIVHPIVAYELSDGCSVGCWFCGISAEKFRGHFSYDEGEALWRGVLAAMQERFGPAAGTGFCYWATDPLDNPDYVRFLNAYREINGNYPQTTTAIPLRRPDLTREVLALWESDRCVTNRFSVLSVNILRRLHQTFTAEELIGVELVLQQSGALSTKAFAGRVRPEGTIEDLNDQMMKKARSRSTVITEGTIACVTGFLVNMVKRTIRLVSPCRPTEAVPDGYHVFAEASFTDAHDYAAVLDRMIAEHIVNTVPADARLAFRDDLAFERLGRGFQLRNKHVRVKISRFGDLAEMIASGDHTVDQLAARCREANAEPLEALLFIDQSYRAGLLAERTRRLPIAAGAWS